MIRAGLRSRNIFLQLESVEADTEALAAGTASHEDCLKFAEAVLYICVNGAEKKAVVKRIMDTPQEQMVALQASITRTRKQLVAAACTSPASSVAASDASTCTYVPTVLCHRAAHSHPPGPPFAAQNLPPAHQPQAAPPAQRAAK